MDAKTLERLRPADDSVTAIRAAQVQTRDERRAVQQRLEDHVARRTGLLLTGTNAQIRAAEEAVREAELDLARLVALADALAAQHTEAMNCEAGLVLAQKVREAIPAIEAFNAWFGDEYAPLARAIADGLELERLALQKIDAVSGSGTPQPTGLPALANAHVGGNSRALGFLIRLPAARAGQEPFWWPR